MSLWLEVSFTDRVRAGQFVSLYLEDEAHLLPRPISVCDINRRLCAIRFVYRVVGEGTRAISALRTGDTVDVMGPLGNGFPLEEAAGRRVMLFGGGLGVPPMLGCIRDLFDEPCDADRAAANPKAVSAALGYADEPFLLEAFEEVCKTFVASDSGRVGVKGTVIDAARENTLPVDLIFACGPEPMLRASYAYAKEIGARCYVSMEERMACGVGACLGCVCRTKTEDAHFGSTYRRVCADGPVFLADTLWGEG